MRTCLWLLLVFVATIAAQRHLGSNCTQSTDCGGQLVCRKDIATMPTCSYCNSTQECQDIFFLYDCKVLGDNKPACMRKSLFPRVSLIDGVMIVIAWAAGALASISGIGGSAILVPMFQIVGQFPLSVAITIAKATVFGMSLTNMFILVRKTHPNTDIPLINYAISAVFVPSVLLGILLGVLLILILPEIILLAMLMLILPPTAIRTLIQAWTMWKKESSGEDKVDELKKYDRLSDEDRVPHNHSEQYVQIGLIAISWMILLFLTMFKGGFGTGSIIGVKACSAWYWVLYSANFPLVGAIILGVSVWMFIKDRRLVASGYVKKFYDFNWNLVNTIMLPFWSMLSGVLSTALGAALIRNSVLTEMGVDVEIAAATCSFVNLWDSSLSTILFIIHGTLPWDYGAIFFGTGLIAGLMGQYILGYVVGKLNRKSIISFILGGLILFACAIMAGLGIYNFVLSIQKGEPFQFKSPCGIHN